MGVTKRAGRNKDAANAQSKAGNKGQPQIMRAVFESNRKKEVGVSDLTLISKITNEAINDNLKERFQHGEIYTYISHVLVSVNPFRDLGIYTQTIAKSYPGKNRLECNPHVFAVAESAYSNMQNYYNNQCVIISGESGAGKTEAAKRMMEYIAQRSGKSTAEEVVNQNLPSETIKEKVLATNPLLESFGNAKTLRNNNSSRFGKYLELHFKEQNIESNSETDTIPLEPVGARITNYLLEKTRVVGQTLNERNFHIFYQFTKGASKELRGKSGSRTILYILLTARTEDYGLQGPESYEYLRRSKCLDVPGIDDVGDFNETLKAMKTINVSPAEQNNIFRMIALILWVGNISFREDDNGNATIYDPSVSEYVAYLLEVNHTHVTKALTVRIVETSRGGRRGSVYDVPLNVTQATAVRDALAKALYFNLFDWIVGKLNVSLKPKDQTKNTLGILDIYGFEIFDKNSFEQLCINYVNEKLQQIFIQLTLRAEQEEYARERIQWTPIKYFDNKVVCDLIEEKRPPGILAGLNDACATAHADPGAAQKTFVSRLNALSSNPHFQPRQGQFIVKHYAGDVNYAVEGMTDKNKDQLLKDLLNLVAGSNNAFVRSLFPDEVNQDDKRRPPTAGDKIKISANDLVETLMQASPSYIRTIKPNETKSPSEYNTNHVLHQIKYLGLQENVRIRRAGFAYRQEFKKFFERFYPLSPNISYGVVIRDDFTKYWGDDVVEGTKMILRDTKIPREEYQMGVTMVFIKSPETIFALEDMRDKHYISMMIRLQRVWRNYSLYRNEAAKRIQHCWRRGHGGDEYQKLRDYGHQVLQGRKERRRFSLIGYRRYLGDYLAMNSGEGLGEAVRKSINLSGYERVLFSSRCEALVTKFGRSSKPEPRILALTNKAVYLVVLGLVNKQATISAERTIPLGAIKFVGTSSLKDDWFSIGVGSSQEPDPLISCSFKTEFFTYLKRSLPGGALDLRIGESIEYNKKPGKPSVVKAVKDPSVQRDDFYKSGSIHTGPGEPANSLSKRTPRGKPRAARPITVGKLIRRSKKSKTAQVSTAPKANSANLAKSRITPASTVVPSRYVPQPSTTQSQPTVQPQPQTPIVNGAAQKRKALPSRVQPPPPPIPAAINNRFKALYDFDDSSLSPTRLSKDEILEVVQKDDKGWWLVRKSDRSPDGWVPSAYLKEAAPEPVVPPAPPIRAVPPPLSSSNTNGFSYTNSDPIVNGADGTARTSAAKAKPTPPAPPKRPVAKGRKPLPPPTLRDSAISLGTSSSGSGRATPDSTSDANKNPSLAADIASMIRARNTSMQGKKNDDDDDW